MSHMITLDLSRAVGSIQVRDDAVRRLLWRSTSCGLAVTNLVTDGPKHVALIAADRDVEMTKVAQHFQIWYEPSFVLVLRGLIRNDWHRTVGRTGHYGWQQIHPQYAAIVPPEASHARYHVRHGPDWKDPSHIVIKEGSLLLLAAPGTRAEPRTSLLGVDLEDYLGSVRIEHPPAHLQSVPRWNAEALVHEEQGEVAAGIYRHHGSRGSAFPHGMISLALPCLEDGPPDVHPALLLSGPNEFVPPPPENSWSVDAMFF